MIAISKPEGRGNAFGRHSDPGLVLGIGSVAESKVSVDEIPELRKRLAGDFKETLTGSVVKNADEQSLVAMMALSEAIRQRPIERPDEWGIIAAPRYLGRLRCMETIRKFLDQGAWGASPHVIPHCMLHSLSGLLSQAFAIHGPNMGAGGSRGGEREALMAAFGWLSAGRLPGVWLVLTGWDDEETAYRGGICSAIAVGLTSAAAGLPKLRLVPSRHEGEGEQFSLECLGNELSNGWNRSARWSVAHVGNLQIEPVSLARAA